MLVFQGAREKVNENVEPRVPSDRILRRCRFFRERFKDVFWNVKTPEDKKLTDDDITRFVISMRNVSMHAMFSPTAFVDFTKVFFVLASFRPDLIVPALLDRCDFASCRSVISSGAFSRLSFS